MTADGAVWQLAEASVWNEDGSQYYPPKWARYHGEVGTMAWEPTHVVVAHLEDGWAVLTSFGRTTRELRGLGHEQATALASAWASEAHGRYVRHRHVLTA